MGRDLGERLTADHKPIAKQRWRKLSSWVKHNHIPSSGFIAILTTQYVKQAAICCTTQEKFRIAMLFSQAAILFMDGIDVLDRDSLDNELTESTEETDNVGSSYYCQQCDQLVTASVVVNMTSPLCQGCFMEECDGVSSFHLAKPSESESLANASDEHDLMEMPPPDQTVLDIVEIPSLDSSRFHNRGSHDYNNYGETDQELGHDDSNLISSHLIGVGSESSDHAVLYVSSSNIGLLPASPLPLGLGANVGPDQPNVWTRLIINITSSVWIFSFTGLGFEAVSTIFDQMSSPQKPRYALYGMLWSIVAVLVCILDLILNAMKQRGITSENNIICGVLPEIVGLAFACAQCISSAVQYS